MGGWRLAGPANCRLVAGRGSLASSFRAGAGSGDCGRSVGRHTAAAKAGLLPPAAGSRADLGPAVAAGDEDPLPEYRGASVNDLSG